MWWVWAESSATFRWGVWRNTSQAYKEKYQRVGPKGSDSVGIGIISRYSLSRIGRHVHIVVNCQHCNCNTCVDIFCLVCTIIYWALEDGHVGRNNINKMSFIIKCVLNQNVVSNLQREYTLMNIMSLELVLGQRAIIPTSPPRLQDQ